MSCTNLTTEEIRHLTRILQLLPDADLIAYTTRVTTLLSSSSLTPSRLKRPHRISAWFRRSTPSGSPSPPLCDLHSRLNAYTTHSLFTRLTFEVGRNLNSLVLHHQLLNAGQRELIERVRELHALWLSPTDYRKTFLQVPPPPTTENKWSFQCEGCEACILARVGGDVGVLLDLRTVVLSRTKTAGLHGRGNMKTPTLLRFVEAWLEGLKVGGEVLEENWREAQALKRLRKEIWRERAKERYMCSDASEPEAQSSRVTQVGDVPDLYAAAASAIRGEKLDSDLENDIIGLYAAPNSTLDLPPLLAGSGTTVIVSERSSISNNKPSAPGQWNRSAEEQARSYQNLLATPPLQDKSEWDLDSATEEERSHTASTSWSSIGEFDSQRRLLRYCRLHEKEP
jgi:hypothetical protein